MSEPSLVLHNALPDDSGDAVFSVHSASGKKGRFGIQSGARVLYPTSGDPGPWTIQFHLEQHGNAVARGELSTADAEAEVFLQLYALTMKSSAASHASVPPVDTAGLARSWWPLTDLIGLEPRDGDRSVLLNYSQQHQQQTQWCWAAVTSSICAYFGDTGDEFKQCRLANRAFAQRSCCKDGSTPACDQPQSTREELRRVGHFAGDGSAPLDFSTIRREIDEKRPIVVRIEWSDGTGHAVVICGYEVRGSVEYMLVKDPDDEDDSPIPVRPNRSLFGGTWDASYFVKHA